MFSKEYKTHPHLVRKINDKQNNRNLKCYFMFTFIEYI